jgi:hypothetical protein
MRRSDKMARRRQRITVFQSGDREEIVGEVAQEFDYVATNLLQGAERQVALAAFKDKLLPQLEVLKASPLYQRLPKASYFKACGETFPVPGDMYVPILKGYTFQSDYSGYGIEGLGTFEELVEEYGSEETTTKWEKSKMLLGKGVEVRRELLTFLEKFERADQVPFSLPEIHRFIQKVRTQKRPRIVVQPSETLRRLVREAGFLKEART